MIPADDCSCIARIGHQLAAFGFEELFIVSIIKSGWICMLATDALHQRGNG